MTDKKLTLPTIHLNGTSVESLQSYNETAYEAVQAALGALRAAGPNGRDYYPQAPGAFEKAASEHEARLEHLRAVRRELEVIGEHLAREAALRAARRAP